MNSNELRLDALGELINIGCGKAAKALSQMTRSEVELFAPEIKVLDECRLADYAEGFSKTPCDVTALDFSGSLSGQALLLLLEESADNLVALLTQDMGIGELDPGMRADALRETGNVVLIWIAGAMANALGHDLTYSPLRYGRGLDAMLPDACDPTGSALLIKAGFSLRHRLVSGDILFLFPAAEFRKLLEAVDRLILEATSGT